MSDGRTRHRTSPPAVAALLPDHAARLRATDVKIAASRPNLEAALARSRAKVGR